MKILKKSLIIILTVLMFVASAPLEGFVGFEFTGLPDINFGESFGSKANAANELAPTGQCGDNVYWEYDSATGELVISGSGSMYDCTVYNKSPFYNSSIKSVIINVGVTTIGYNAFYDCHNLTSITIGDSVTTIGDYAFSACNILERIIIPSSVTEIRKCAFSDCKKLSEIILCNGITSIGYGAFIDCDSLISVMLPDSLEFIDGCLFWGCNSLINITVSENNKYFSSDADGVLYNKDKSVLIQYPNGNKAAQYTIPNTVRTIASRAFSSSENLTSVVVPDSVTTIDGAFEDCCSLTHITVVGDNPAYSSDDQGILFDKNKTTIIKYPAGKPESSYRIPDGVSTIRPNAFADCQNLAYITIPDSMETISVFSFNGCYSLKSINIPDSVTNIGVEAFYDCENLTSVTIPDSVTNIGSGAFDGCEALEKVVLSNNLTSIPLRSFRDCINLKDIKIPNSVENIGVSAFDNCTSLKNITIPDSVITIGGMAFYNCTGLTNDLIIPNSVTTIGDSAFAFCSGLTSIFIPKSISNIGENAFNSCNFKYVCYEGREDQWKEMAIAEGLSKTDIHYVEDNTFSNYVSDKNATCQSTGTKTAYCDVCGAKDTIVDDVKGDHLYEVVELVEASCTTNGKAVYQCKYCTESYEEILKAGHIFYEAERVGSTCTQEGKVVYKCQNCTESYVIILPSHTLYEAERIYWSCTQDGKVVYKCKNCDYSKEEIFKASHILYEVERIEQTCTQDGKIVYKCQNCNYSEEVILTSKGHMFYEKEQIEATCTQDGKVVYKCKNCTESYEKIVYGEHIYKEVERIEQTCTTKGKVVYECKFCAKPYEVTLYPSHILYETEQVKATCTQEGKIVYNCKNCDHSEEIMLPLETHAYEVERVEATCTSEGKVVYECKNCTESYVVVLPIRHLLVDIEYVEATCTTDGRKKGTCTECGVEVVETIPASHIGKWVVTIAETCAREGLEERKCSVCGEVETRSRYKLPHIEATMPARAATCTMSGYTIGRGCEVCGVIFSGCKTIPALGHDLYIEDNTYYCKDCKYSMKVNINVELFKVSDFRLSSSNKNSYTLSWSECLGADGYELLRIEKTTGRKRIILIGANDTKYTVDSNDGSAYYTIRAFGYVDDERVCGDWSAEVYGADLPKAPQNIRCYTECENIIVEWDADENVLGYEVFQKTESGYYKSVIKTSDSSVKFSELAVGETYSFKVRAFIGSESNPWCGNVTDAVTVYFHGHIFSDWSTEGNKSTRYCEVCNYTETKINTDGGDVEIEAPDQSEDTDFVVDEIVSGGKDYIVIEEAVSNGTDNNWEVIKAFDINLKNHDGVHVQPDGTVKVKLPLDWSKDGNYKVYRVNDDGTLTDMNAYRQGSHMVFDTDHFSIYVIVEEKEEFDTPESPDIPDVPVTPDEPTDNCSHMCHKGGLSGFIWKIVRFFWKLFKMNPVCECGVKHY